MNAYIEIRHNFDSEQDEVRGTISKIKPILAVLIVDKAIEDVAEADSIREAKEHFESYGNMQAVDLRKELF